MTCVTWWGVNIQNVSSPAPTAWGRQCLEDSEQKDDLVIQLINDKGVYRTAMAHWVC